MARAEGARRGKEAVADAGGGTGERCPGLATNGGHASFRLFCFVYKRIQIPLKVCSLSHGLGGETFRPGNDLAANASLPALL
jgi:hypothetical protein